MLVAAVMLGAQQVLAESWPSGPIRLINPLAAGSAPDILSRLIAEQLGRALGQQVVVDNRPGAANLLATQAAARAAPDGQTLFFGTSLALAVNPHTFKTLPYDAGKDFAPIGMIGRAPFFIVVHPEVSATTLGELIALDKAKRNQLALATDGPKNSSGMLAAWLNKRTGMELLQVPYPSMAQGVQDVIAGRVQLAVLAGPIARPLIEQGTLRALAVSSLQRLPGYLQVPTIADTLPGFEFIGWFILAAPAGTSPDVIARLNKELDQILKRPELAARFAELGIYNEGADTVEGTRNFVRAQRSLWGEIVRTIGLQPE
jgi:tripartite-type tricarboxylate transporter receptor subunit TctC